MLFKMQKRLLVLVRVVMGWMFFYAGITKLIDPAWSAEGYLRGAKMLTGFFAWLASPAVLPIVNVLNEWGLTLLGVSLIFGIGVRLTSILGAGLMILYWLPLGLPMPDAHSYIVDDHVIYAVVLLLLASLRAGRYWGLDSNLSEESWMG